MHLLWSMHLRQEFLQFVAAFISCVGIWLVTIRLAEHEVEIIEAQLNFETT